MRNNLSPLTCQRRLAMFEVLLKIFTNHTGADFPRGSDVKNMQYALVCALPTFRWVDFAVFINFTQTLQLLVTKNIINPQYCTFQPLNF